MKKQKAVRWQLKNFVLMVVTIFCLLEAAVVVAAVETRITTDPGVYRYPTISGNRIVWWDERNGNHDIYMYDISTGVETRITTDPGGQRFPSISGDRIVWWDTRNGSNDIYMYDISTDVETQITTDTAEQVYPSISGDRIVWVGYPCCPGDHVSADNEIYMYYITTGTQIRITVDSAYQDKPKISGDRIVWEDYRNGNPDIYMYDISTGVETQITTGTAHQLNPSISGDRIVWEDYRNGNKDIYMYDISTGVETRITTDPGGEDFPSISGDRIVWADHRNGNSDIYMYDISTGGETQITTDPAHQSSPSISGDRIVWIDFRYGNSEVAPVDIYMYDLNSKPVACGQDQTVHVGSVVTLDATCSYDTDGNYPLSYAWDPTATPDGDDIGNINIKSATTSFTADVPGEYVIMLIVTDSTGLKSDPIYITVSTSNTRPIAAAGPDQSITQLYTTVQLDGTQSWDPDGDPITYAWGMKAPVGSAASLSDPTSATPTFVADVAGDYSLKLIVSDPWSASDPDSLTVSYANVKPVADAGGNQSVTVGDMVVLDGNGTTDANGDPLTYLWSFVSMPQGSTATLSRPNMVDPRFTADMEGTYVLSLVVNDGTVDSDPDNVTVFATYGTESIINILREAIWTVNHMDPSCLKNQKMADALTNKISAAIHMISNGQYQDALDKLVNDILGKTDGCALGGAPDNNDWIKDCRCQARFYEIIMEAINILRAMP